MNNEKITKILAYNAGHDGSAALIDDRKLVYSLEAEKDSGRRHSFITPTLFINSLRETNLPDVIAVSGWIKPRDGFNSVTEASYHGVWSDAVTDVKSTFGGREIRLFSSSHERSHIMCSYGLSPFAHGQPCYALVWEGGIGAFYFIDESVQIRRIGSVMSEPGNKYAFLYSLADASVPLNAEYIRFEDAGKLMALSAYGTSEIASDEQQQLISDVFTLPLPVFGQAHKSRFVSSRYCNIGVESQEFKDIARLFSDAMFDRFYQFAKYNLPKKLPLIISGGCGLNCDWNTRWRMCGLFSDVFVPPCTNDSGVAIGAAVDALRHYTGVTKIDWDVYSGDAFLNDVEAQDVSRRPLDLGEVSDILKGGGVIAWVQGRYELGPRALGNRSLLAAPFSEESRVKLNRLKKREMFRPIAPVCLEEELDKHFDHTGVSPHMLYFQNVKSAALKAVTHVDGTARVQTVSEKQNPKMYALLQAFKSRTGFGVLCNTSLNFSGYGFINRMSELIKYSKQADLDGFVVDDVFYRTK